VRSWTMDAVELERLDLGEYAEPMRLYLLGDAEFPADTIVTVVVSSLRDVNLMASLPEQSDPFQGYRSYFFAIPGLAFMVDAGPDIPQTMQQECLYRGPQRPIFYSAIADFRNAVAYAEQRRLRGQSVP